MMIKFARFNIYLLAVLWLLSASGCQSPQGKKERAEKKQVALIQFHLEVNQDGTPSNEPVPVFREKPMYFNVDKSPFADTSNVESAKVVDTIGGGFAIQVKLDWEGTQLLDGVTTGSRGRHIVVFSDFGQKRWLAAPVISKRISDGVFTFTPDATREETDRIVRGLNNLVKKEKKRDSVFDETKEDRK
jgi:hypothetical protein